MAFSPKGTNEIPRRSGSLPNLPQAGANEHIESDARAALEHTKGETRGNARPPMTGEPQLP
jgi:hypothetical protein